MNQETPADPDFLLRETLLDRSYAFRSVDGTLWIEELMFSIPLRCRHGNGIIRRWRDLRFGAVEALEQIQKFCPPQEFLKRLLLADWQQWMLLILEPIARQYEVTSYELLHAWSAIHGPTCTFQITHAPGCPLHREGEKTDVGKS